MILVLIVGGGPGWTIQRANTQRRIVAAIEGLGGSVEYDDRYPRGNLDFEEWEPFPPRRSWVPQWLVDRVGIDYFHTVSTVELQPRSEEQAFAAIAMLKQLGPPWIVTLHGPLFADPFVGRLEELNGIEGIRLISLRPNGTNISDAGIEHLKGLTKLPVLLLDGTHVSAAGKEKLKAALPHTAFNAIFWPKTGL